MRYGGLTIVALAMLVVGGARGGVVTLESLLIEMTDRDALARLNEPSYECKQASSYQRLSVSPDKEGWYANQDWSHFIRKEENDGRVEWVMLDVDGPGCIVRFWMGGNAPYGKLRFYLDGAAKPVIEETADALLGHGALVGRPLSAVRSRGLNFFFPIPYARGCKITYDGPNYWETKNRGHREWYNINYRIYERETSVRSFTHEQLAEAGLKLTRIQRRLIEPGIRIDRRRLGRASATSRLPSGVTELVELEGPRAIRELAVKISADNLGQALRSTILRIEFDGAETVWCPVGDFFGSGFGLNPYRSWQMRVLEDGSMVCNWVMPFEKGCRISMENLSDETVSLDLADVRWEPWQWDERSMHFNAVWRQYSHVKVTARQGRDMNYVTITGQGKLVGDSLALFNCARAWWGEGDEKIFVDGETFPSTFGTGTEDYYGYSFGGSSVFYEGPFHAQPVAAASHNESGRGTNLRVRALDAIPFSKSLKLDMELWHWENTYMHFSPTTYFYARPGARSNIEPSPEDAKRKVPRAIEDVAVVHRVESAFEGENLEISKITGGRTEIQNNLREGWSNNRQLWWRDGSPGDELVLDLPEVEAGTYEVFLNLTKAADYGIAQFYLNDTEVSSAIDLYNRSVVTTGNRSLGKAALKGGPVQLRIKIVGANPAAEKRHMVGLDYIKLVRE
ncbi:MAG: glycoside hydrolase family 172 protein [Planctomycetota bacterium]|jgi:hypothetical protein